MTNDELLRLIRLADQWRRDLAAINNRMKEIEADPEAQDMRRHEFAILSARFEALTLCTQELMELVAEEQLKL